MSYYEVPLCTFHKLNHVFIFSSDWEAVVIVDSQVLHCFPVNGLIALVGTLFYCHYFVFVINQLNALG